MEERQGSIEQELAELWEQVNHWQRYHGGGHESRSYEGRSQGRVLHLLQSQGDLYQKELQYILGIRPGSMSEIVTKLEKRGLLVRKRDEKDMRRARLSITEEGMACVRQYEQRQSSRIAALFSGLTTEEKQVMKSALKKMLRSECGMNTAELKNCN
ncbi:MAG: MarR family transcriptional regulator [Lachnospiraceae bacterium]|nr:MarR family transcriptional regulator [Lachnospiraceae bacterium]